MKVLFKTHPNTTTTKQLFVVCSDETFDQLKNQGLPTDVLDSNLVQKHPLSYLSYYISYFKQANTLVIKLTGDHLTEVQTKLFDRLVPNLNRSTDALDELSITYYD